MKKEKRLHKLNFFFFLGSNYFRIFIDQHEEAHKGEEKNPENTSNFRIQLLHQ